MTAEQFWQYWDDKKWAKPSPEIVKPVCVAFAEAYHRAEPAAQLAEKEREIARLEYDIAQLDRRAEAAEQRVAKLCEEFESQRQARLAAEQRLQEAQARINYLENVKVRAGRGERSTS